MTEIKCWTDGSCVLIPNKGVGECGIGYVIADDAGNILYCGGEYIGQHSSSYAEMYAILRCMEEVNVKIDDDITSMCLFSDSKVSVDALEEEVELNDPDLIEIMDRIESESIDMRVVPTFVWTPAAQDRYNRLADSMAYTCSSGTY